MKINLKSMEVKEALIEKLGKKYIKGFDDFNIMELTTDFSQLAGSFGNDMNKTLLALTAATADGRFDAKDKYVVVKNGEIYSIKLREYKKYVDFCFNTIMESLVATELKEKMEKPTLTASIFGFKDEAKTEQLSEVQEDIVEEDEEIVEDASFDEDEVKDEELDYNDYDGDYEDEFEDKPMY